jgi:hypothetical protein|tara:strand:+ start:28 stop:552 length:525 start_codon:yes stop_codon:yes gene_type:complete
MSKKSRKRNKKILGVLGALGAAALLGKHKRTRATDAASDAKAAAVRAMTQNDAYSAASPVVTGTEYPGANKVLAAPASTGNTGNTVVRHGGITKSDSGQLVGATNAMSPGVRAQIMQAKANAPKNIIKPGNYAPPLKRKLRTFKSGGRVAVKHGGRITGIAKRGVSPILLKGKK